MTPHHTALQTIACHGMLIDDSSQKLESLYTLLNEPITLLNREFFVIFILSFINRFLRISATSTAREIALPRAFRPISLKPR
jgi:hypothetical protein